MFKWIKKLLIKKLCCHKKYSDIVVSQTQLTLTKYCTDCNQEYTIRSSELNWC